MQVNAYINFNGNCLEAMSFYKDCLGGELQVIKVKDTPAGASCPGGTEDQVMHSSLINKGFVIMATDMVDPGGFKPGNNFSLSVNCTSEEELNRTFNAIMEGGNIVEPIKLQFWGDLFGYGSDKFGTRWMFNYTKTPQPAVQAN